MLWVLLLWVLACAKTKAGKNRKIIKMLIDEERWFMADFAYVSNLEEAHVEKMEQFVLIDILNFNAKISDEDFIKEKLALQQSSTVPKKRLTVV